MLFKWRLFLSQEIYSLSTDYATVKDELEEANKKLQTQGKSSEGKIGTFCG